MTEIEILQSCMVLKIFELRDRPLLGVRIPTVKLKIPEKSIFKIRILNFCNIQVIVFDFSYLPVAAVGTWQVRYHEKIVKNTFYILMKDSFYVEHVSLS